MKIKNFLLLVMMLVIVMSGLTGCYRAASTESLATATSSGAFPVPGTETMGLFETIATQTAMAAKSGGTTTSATNTPVPEILPTNTTAPTVPQVTEAQPTAVPPTATKAPVIVVPTATPGLPTTYTLQQGEYPYCIARRFNINPATLLSVNGLSENSLVQPGTTLTIPQNATGFPGNRTLHSHPTTYTVKSGDTLNSIACYFGDVDPSAIAAANNLSTPYDLKVGETLQIP